MTHPEAVGRAVLSSLAAHRERRRIESQELRASIARLYAADDGPAWGRASRIQAKLPAPKPALRTVRWHLKAILESATRTALPEFSSRSIERAERAT